MSETDSPQDTIFTPTEARILACLMEKHLTTPDNYPLTINSLTLACNQKSNREPIMNLSQGQVGHTVNELAERDLVHIDYGERAQRIHHKMPGAFGLTRKQQALLAVLMVRTTPRTLNELRSRSERMAEFEDVQEVLLTLEELMQREPPLVICLPKGQGRREDRYAHLFCGPVDVEVISKNQPPPASAPSEDRLRGLEERVADLEQRLSALMQEIESRNGGTRNLTR